MTYRMITGRLFKAYKHKMNSNVWIFHLNDLDPWPSVPHGHSYASKPPMVIDVYSGVMYNKSTGKEISKANKKDMNNLISKKEYLRYEIDAVTEFMKREPKLYAKLGYPKRNYKPVNLLRNSTMKKTAIVAIIHSTQTY